MYQLLSEREKTMAMVESFGTGAPFIFMLIQILQVAFAPIPGEATGFIGGYIFGAAKGFFYSSLGLTIGSCLNFFIGRFLGKRYIRKLIPEEHLNRFDAMVRRQGIIVLFILFVIPGFPKDYLCLFLGMSLIPFKAFFLMATLGRMPGTLMLSLQGALIYEKLYGLFSLIMIVCLIVVALAYKYRDELYGWVEK